MLWPTLWAVWIAGRGKPDARIFLIFVTGTVLMRSAGCAINDYADRSFDPHVERTKTRPLAAGRITTIEALVLFAALSLLALMLVLQLNRMTLLCALPRRFSRGDLSVRQAFHAGAAAVSRASRSAGEFRMAFEAQVEYIPRVAWLFVIANVIWVTVYDTLYAMVDRDDDLKIGVRSTAILFGDSDRHIIAVLQAMTLVTLYLAGRILHMTRWYYAGLIAGAMFFVCQLWLIRNRDRDACFRAFLNNNYFGLSVFIGILLLTSSALERGLDALSASMRAGRDAPSIGPPRPTMRRRCCRREVREAAARAARLDAPRAARRARSSARRPGRARRALKRRYPSARVIAVDASAERMLRVAGRRRRLVATLRARVCRCGAAAARRRERRSGVQQSAAAVVRSRTRCSRSCAACSRRAVF